ncbi:MAG: cell division protein FtsA [Kiritimatiellia bacterium]
MKNEPIVVLDIGTSRTVVCVGKADENDNVRMLGMGSYPTAGVRKGQIVDFKNVVNCIETARKEAQKNSEVSIWKVVASITGDHISAEPYKELLPINSSDKIVTLDDMEELDARLREPPLDSERVVLHTLFQHFRVDEQPGVINPENMKCNMLHRHALVVSGLANRVENLKRVIGDDKLDVMDIVFDGVAASLAVLNTAQKRDGVVLIDIGAGTTSVVTFCGRIVADVFCIGVGGDHITNDIAKGFSIPFNRAEALKREFGRAVLDADRAYTRISLSKEEERFGPESVSEKSLQIIINARMAELFKIIRERLEDLNLLDALGAGVVLTGGGALLTDVDRLSERVFSLPSSSGQINNVLGFDGVENQPSFATAAGLLKYTFEGIKQQESNTFLGSLLEKLTRW